MSTVTKLRSREFLDRVVWVAEICELDRGLGHIASDLGVRLATLYSWTNKARYCGPRTIRLHRRAVA